MAESSLQRFNRRRRLKDTTVRWIISAGGIGVILAVVLIFFYLLWVVLPVFGSAQVSTQSVQLSDLRQPVLTQLEEQFEVASTLQADGKFVFTRLSDGQNISSQQLPLATGQSVVTATMGPPGSDLLVAGLSDGHYLLVKLTFKSHYNKQGEGSIEPEVSYPFGSEARAISGAAQIQGIAVVSTEDQLLVAAIGSDQKLYIEQAELTENLLSEEIELDSRMHQLELPPLGVNAIAMSANQKRLYLGGLHGEIRILDLQQMQWLAGVKVSSTALTSIQMLLGGVSVLTGDRQGHIYQSFPVRDSQGKRVLKLIRQFPPLHSAVRKILPEARRKGFVALTENGEGGLYYSSSARKLADLNPPTGITTAALAPRADGLVILDKAMGLQVTQIINEHPELSFSTLWKKVWYEGYDQPELIWQSSASNDDFEPKFSLSPLTFGTLKAAFYAMLFAVPLALLGALYTAYFMSAAMRQLVKPTIEIMEALPTVVLGFLAGLWFAPWLELHLMGVFTVVLLMPLGLLGFAWLFHQLQLYLQQKGYYLPVGWQAAIMIPGVLLVVLVLLKFSVPLEEAFFAGDLRLWFKQEWGIGYDQRNAMVVGFAMGFAVIPTIFSMAEDALFSVPKGLTAGSLALGGTPWQTAIRVVLPTASPGIFSALMIGLGRAVGETMIVLMATGNTPLMDFNLFEGMRSLSANIAVELPEAAVNSSHYRILFIAALVLFVFTFIVNTVAEIVRQRLRVKYSSL